MQIGQSLASYRNAVATLLTMAWPEGQDPVVNASAGVDNTRMLNHAYNAMLRAARDHGVEGDPMLKWVRKADGLLRQCYTGVYLESQADIAMARCKPAFLPDFDVSLLSFAAISAACRSALDTRVAINEGYCRRSKATAYQDAGPSSVCSIVKPVFNVTMQQIVEAIIVKNPMLSRREIVIKLRNVYNGVLKGKWANDAGVRTAWEALVLDGLADIAPTQVDPEENDDGEDDSEYRLLENEDLSDEAYAKKLKLLSLPNSRRGGVLTITCPSFPTYR